MVRYNTVLGTDTKPKFQQKKSKVKVMYFSDGALPQPVILVSQTRLSNVVQIPYADVGRVVI